MVIENLEVNGKVHTEIIKEKKLDKNSVTIQASAGAIGGCATRFFCQPLDVLKIRFQVNRVNVRISCVLCFHIYILTYIHRFKLNPCLWAAILEFTKESFKVSLISSIMKAGLLYGRVMLLHRSFQYHSALFNSLFLNQ